MKQAKFNTETKLYGHKLLFTAILLFLTMTDLGAQSHGSYAEYLKYTLQKTPGFKGFVGEDSIPHYFVQFYGGATSYISPGLSKGINDPGLEAGVAVGRWFTPVHGVRIGFSGKYYNAYPGKKVRAKELDLSADYLMNLSALASDFNAKRKFELVGIAGGEYMFPQFREVNGATWGIRTGLQARYALDYGSVIFLEPRVGIYSDNLDYSSRWRNYDVAASLAAGMEFRTVPRNIRSTERFSSSTFKDHTFLYGGAGIGSLLVPGGSDLQHYAGGSFFAGVGRWLSPYSGVRLTGKAILFKYPVTKSKIKGLGAQADYLLNISNTFYGYNPDRFFNMIAIAGVNYDYLKNRTEQNLLGLGVGAQASFRLSREFNFFVEPRLNYYPGKYYAIGANGAGPCRANFLLNTGLELNANPVLRGASREKMTNGSFLDHTFIGLGIGVNSPVTQAAFFKYNVDPRAGGFIGKWFTATSGVRLSADIARLWRSNKQPDVKLATVSADYLWNITSFMNGYDPGRKFELIGVTGANVAFRSSSLFRSSYLGGELGLQGLWNVTPSFGLFLEPQLRLYSDDFMERNIHFAKMDGVFGLMAGVNLRLKDCGREQKQLFMKGDEKRSFFSFSGGTEFLATHIRRANAFGVSGQMALGKWITPISGWRIDLNGEFRQENRMKYLYGGAEADYMLSLTTMALGYDSDRRLDLNALAGVNLGMDYERKNVGVAPGISLGGQVVFKASPTIDLFVEPKATLRTSLRNNPSYYSKGIMNVQVGFNYKLSPDKIAHAKDFATDDHSQYFISANLGAGMYGGSYKGSFKAKNIGNTFGLAVGKRMSPVSYVRLGVNHKELVDAFGDANAKVTSVNADYLANLSTLAGGYDKDRKLELMGVIGGSLNFASKEGYKSATPLGLKLGLQTKFNLSKKIDLTLESAVNFYNKTIDNSFPRRGKEVGEFTVGINYKL